MEHHFHFFLFSYTMTATTLPKLASKSAILLLLTIGTSLLSSSCAFFTPSAPLAIRTQSSSSRLFAKKKKGNTPRPNPNYSSGKKQQQQEKASVKEARFDAATRQFMFTLVGLTKTLPDKSKDILKNINLSFYPGAKIGVVGLNGSGKVSINNVSFFGVQNVSSDNYLNYYFLKPQVNSTENHGRDRKGI
jgi:ABC-type multidrug transport system fused ATPase/permease subunit